MTKDYPCDADYLLDVDSDQLIGYWSKGHHSGEALLAAVRWEFDEAIDFDVTAVKQVYYRAIPDPDVGYWFQETKPGCGAFPATVIEL